MKMMSAIVFYSVSQQIYALIFGLVGQDVGGDDGEHVVAAAMRARQRALARKRQTIVAKVVRLD